MLWLEDDAPAPVRDGGSGFLYFPKSDRLRRVSGAPPFLNSGCLWQLWKEVNMHGNACTRHPRGPGDYRQGRCIFCRRESARKYQAKCRAELRQFREIKRMLCE